ncbi:hypothetical protein MN202_08065 [Rheinheimera muenzenbergensis]|uniref:Uncharacterized protein n=1 Tax=Rheinheimera muenzenbergensis TaxID=1193628 RepID=A0ABU8C6F9_9GAMM
MKQVTLVLVLAASFSVAAEDFSFAPNAASNLAKNSAMTQIVTPEFEYEVHADGTTYVQDSNYEEMSQSGQCNEWNSYIRSAGNGNFVNVTNECRWAVFSVTSSRGYSGIWHHKAEPFQPFGWPPYDDRKATVTKSTLTTLACNTTPPGTGY